MPDRRGAVAGALVALTLAACSTPLSAPLKSQSQSLAGDQTLSVHLAEPPRTLDPSLATDEREAAVVRQFSEPLLRPAADLHDVEPAAAESYDTSSDGTIWTFHLRSNGRYADGQPVRAQDFVYSWRRLIDPRTAAPHGSFFAEAVAGGPDAVALGPKDPRVDAALDRLGIRAVDDLTFQVTTAQAGGALRWIATLPEGGPLRQAMLATPGQVGNGPFRVADSSANRITLVPNPNYWAGRTTLSRIVFEFGGAAAAVDAYRAGHLDQVTAPPDTIDSPLRRDLLRSPELTTFWVDFNTTRAPLDNPRVRQALAEGIDRQAVVTEDFQGRAAPATTLIPSGMRGYRPEVGHPQDFNPTAARQLLDQAGVPHDQLTALPMIVRDRPQDRAIASTVAAQLQRNLGVSVAVQALGAADYAKRLRSGDFALAGPAGWTADYPDQQDFFDLFRSTDGNNGARWRSSRYDALVRLADTEPNADKRDQLYNQAEQLLVQEVPVAFLVQRYDVTLVKPYVKGVHPSPVDEWPGATYSTLLYIAAH